MFGHFQKMKRSRTTADKNPTKKRKTTAVVPFKQPRLFIKDEYELKHIDLATAAYSYDTTGQVVLINDAIAVGADDSNRIGRKVTLKRLWIRGEAQQKSAAIINGCRHLVVYDTQTNGALATVTTILESANSKSHRRDDTKERFHILYDKSFSMVGNSTTPATGKEARFVNASIPLGDRLMEFLSLGTGAIADINKGALLFVTVGDNAASGTTTANISVNFRTFYGDK